MTYSELFSKRFHLRPTPEGLMYEDVPERARVGLYHLVEQFFGGEHQKRYRDLYHEICVALRIKRDRTADIQTSDYHISPFIEKLIIECEWHQFYDICEVLWANPYSESNKYKHQEELTEQVNMLFKEEQLGFELRDGKVEKIGSAFTDAKIKEVRYLLKEPEFKSADELFGKAMKSLNIRPKPDVENCVKDAVAAVESVGKVIVGNENAFLDDIIKNAVKNGVIPQPLDQTIIKLHAYRGNEPAIAHGGIEPSKVTIDEAEFVLNMSASIIIYLMKKKNKLGNQ
jgi:hypothetical protein